MAELIRQVYQDVEITYHENSNRWVFELSGKERYASSLREAKEAIDKAPKFKRVVARFPALLVGWGGDKLDEVMVGALSKDFKGRPQFWVSNDGTRSKESVDQLIKLNDANAPLIAEARRMTEQINELKKQRAEKIAAMERVDVPDDATD